MASPQKDTKVRRVQLDLTTAQIERLDDLIARCELSSRKELFNAAMTLFNWATDEVQAGRKIAAYDPATANVETVLLPALEQAARGGPETAIGQYGDNSRKARRGFGVVPTKGVLA